MGQRMQVMKGKLVKVEQVGGIKQHKYKNTSQIAHTSVCALSSQFGLYMSQGKPQKAFGDELIVGRLWPALAQYQAITKWWDDIIKC